MIFIKFLLLGSCTVLLFPPFFMFPLGFLIFPYFYKQLIKLNKKNSILFNFLSGTLYGLGFLGIFFIWLKNPFLINEVTNKYVFLSSFLIIFISFVFGLVFILFKYTRNFSFQIFCIPLFFIIIEMFIANLWYGFPWLTFALIVSNNPIGSYFLYLFGTHATGFFILTLFFIPQIFIDRKKLFGLIKTILLIMLLIFVIIFLIYFLKYEEINKKNFENIDVDLFQMNSSVFSNNNSFIKEKNIEIINFIINSDAELIVLGENNLPYIVSDLNQIELGKFLKPNQTLVIGATRNDNKKYYNSLLVVEKNKIDFFDKKILVPFGEFIPLRTYLGFMDMIAGSVDFSIGTKDRFLKIKDKYTFMPVICYEIIFFWRLLNKKNNFSDFIINITNDAWFGNHIGPYQHFYLTKMRSSELNKPIIRVSNNGITGIIDRNGKILISTELNKKEILNFSFEIGSGINLILLHKILNIVIILFFFGNIYFFIIKKNGKDSI